MTEEPNDLNPQIELPQEAVPLPLIIGLALLLGLGLFLYLDSNRRAMMGDIDGARAGNQTSGPPAPVPDLIIPPPEPPPAPPVVPDPGRAMPAALATTAQPMMPRLGPANVSVGKGADPAVTVMFRRPRGNEPALVADLTAAAAHRSTVPTRRQQRRGTMRSARRSSAIAARSSRRGRSLLPRLKRRSIPTDPAWPGRLHRKTCAVLTGPRC